MMPSRRHLGTFTFKYPLISKDFYIWFSKSTMLWIHNHQWHISTNCTIFKILIILINHFLYLYFIHFEVWNNIFQTLYGSRFQVTSQNHYHQSSHSKLWHPIFKISNISKHWNRYTYHFMKSHIKKILTFLYELHKKTLYMELRNIQNKYNLNLTFLYHLGHVSKSSCLVPYDLWMTN